MSLARSFLLLSAGLVVGGIGSVALVDGEIDWFRYIRARPADRVTQPASLPAPPAAPNFRLTVTAPPPPPAAEPVPETVVVNRMGTGTLAPLRTQPTGGRQLPLAQELQVELQRVGCYAGPVDGSWTSLTQRSMRAFVTGVNANLPVDQPDYALLALVRASRSAVCAKPCLPEQRGVPDTCAAAKPAIASAPAALTRSTATNPPPASPQPTNPLAPQQQPAQVGAVPDAALGLPAPVPQVVQPKRKAAQPKQVPGGFGTDIFKALFQTIY